MVNFPSDFPLEIISIIFKYLEFSDLLALRLVNQGLYAAGSQSHLWMGLYSYKHDYLTNSDYYQRSLIRGQHNQLILKIWEQMSSSFHVLPYFQFLQQTFGLNLIEYCNAKLKSIPKYLQLTLKYYIKKSSRTCIRLHYINHFINKDYSDLLVNVLYVGFITDPDMDPSYASVYSNVLDDLIKQAVTAISKSAPLYQQVLSLLDLFFKKWGFKVDFDNFNAINHACLHHCLTSRKGMPILLSVLLKLIGDALEIDFKLIGFPTKFLLSVTINSDIYYISPFDYTPDTPFFTRIDLLRILRSLSVNENEFEMQLQPVDVKYIVERCLNNLMLCVGQSPVRSLSWFSSIYTCSWCCYLADNMNILEPEFIWEITLSAYCEDFILIHQLTENSGSRFNSTFLDFYYSRITEIYKNNNESRTNEFQPLFSKMKDLLSVKGINPNAPIYSFKKMLPEPVMDRFGVLIDKILTRDILPPVKKYNNCKFDIGDVIWHEQYEYYAVVHDYDENCTESLDWQRIMQVQNLLYKNDQPFYNVIVLTDQSNRYVAQENIVSVKTDSRLKSEFIRIMDTNEDFLFFCGQFFTEFDENSFEFIKNAKTTLKYQKMKV
eukprot:NODE_276_length_12087_cov_0.626376.p1 type:complete len:604 gc:universal NODE_276_length_12087_cov_0.626376:7722-5911(-)